jgi:4-hydroxy-3-methylbut-2-enyl diphosphate reductase
MNKKIYFAFPRGFCGGVRGALEILDKALDEHGTPLYVLHEIVHNDFVVDGLRKRGVVFVEDLREVPRGGTLVFSAHGVSGQVECEAANLGLKVIDATCPLVKKIHEKAEFFDHEGRFVFLIGHPKHPEIIGTLGRLSGNACVVEKLDDIDLAKPPDPAKVAYLTQTTLCGDDVSEIVDELKIRYPEIEGSGDICYATKKRQDAVKELSVKCDAVFIIGSSKSSNSNRLREVAARCGAQAYLIDGAKDIKNEMLEGVCNIGISAGASAPECLLEEAVNFLRGKGWERDC